MRILVTNDDGITAPGLWALVKEVSPIAEVIVVAPDREQSAVGTSITLHQPLRVREAKPLVTGIETYTVEGTPSDSVVMALKLLLKEKPDLIISGINSGSNMGTDVMISGTVAAALQGHFYGLPSIAVSVTAIKNVRYGVAARLTSLTVQHFGKGDLPERLFLNINVPSVPLSRIEGMETTRLAKMSYTDKVKKGHDGRRSYYWIVRVRAEGEVEEGTDIWAVRQKKISITPLRSDLTHDAGLTLVKEICTPLFESLRAK